MALVKFSALISEMRNKLNGSVFSKNRGGNYLRNKVTPVNPQSSFQQNVRGVFAAISSAWRGLTQAQRDGWIAGAASFPYTDIFGDTRTLSGNALHQKLNQNLVLMGESQISVCPLPEAVPLAEALSATAAPAGGAVTLTLDDATVPTGYQLQVWATPGLSQGKQFVKNELRALGYFTLTTGVATLTTEYAARFGNLVAGQKVTFRAVYVSETTGQQGQATEVAAIVA